LPGCSSTGPLAVDSRGHPRPRQGHAAISARFLTRLQAGALGDRSLIGRPFAVQHLREPLEVPFVSAEIRHSLASVVPRVLLMSCRPGLPSACSMADHHRLAGPE
jgi:hypothetical protein